MANRGIDIGAWTLDGRRRRLILAAAAAASLLIFAADALSPIDGAVAVLYTGVVLLAAALGRRFVIAAGFVTGTLTTAAFVWGHFFGAHSTGLGHDPLGGASLRYVVSLVAIAITVLLTLRDGSARVTLAEQARLLELSHDTVVIRDAGNIIRYWNEGAERLYGWTRQEAQGKSCDDLLRTVLPDAGVAGRLAQTGAWSGEMLRTRRDGTTLILASRWLQRRDPEGQPIGIIETSADLTESRQAQAEREASEQRYSTIFNAAGFAALECDLSAAMRIVRDVDGRAQDLERWLRAHPDMLRDATDRIRIYNANKAALGLFEADAASDLVPGAILLGDLGDAEAALAQVFTALAHGASLVETETKCLSRSGRIIDAVLRVSVLPDGLNWSRVLLMAVDVTERNEARAKIERSSAELAHAGRVSILGQLAGSITHEVNQPLAAIINYGKSGKRWLARPEPDLGEIAECLDKIVANGNRAADVVGRVRALARKTAPQAGTVDIATLVQESVALLAREASAAGTAVRVEQKGSPAPIVCDRVQVQQVIVNLLMNALQAMREVSERPREIRILIDGAGEEAIEVAVRDSGSGIDGEPNRIFDPFFTTKSDGMGLGLSICRTIIESQGGRIKAANNPQFGATVSFTLPITIPAEARWRARPNILI